jgi:hypothetical protein
MSGLTRKGGMVLLAVILALSLFAAGAQANRALITETAAKTDPNPKKPIPPPEGEIEGACGVEFAEEKIYVSDYYHQAVERFKLPEAPPEFPYQFDQLISAGTAPEGPCQLALDSKGNLYANLWHQSVVRLLPSFQILDEANCTGVAVDDTGLVYVNERTRIAVYEPSGTFVEAVGAGGALEDAYGLAVFAGRVYVTDAATETVKVFDPSFDPVNPVDSISPPSGFNSLTDGEVTVDPTNGHILVLDNLQPGYEHPKGAIDEFAEDGAFLGSLSHTVIDASPSGLAVDPGTGRLYATSGDSEEANVFVFGPYTEGGPEAVMPPRSPESAPGGEAGAGVGETSAAAAQTRPSTQPFPDTERAPGAHRVTRRHRHIHRRVSRSAAVDPARTLGGR